MFPKRHTKRDRLAAILSEIDTTQIRQLPSECDMPDADSTTSEIGVAKSITIHQDGKTLHGSTTTLDNDFPLSQP